MQVILQEDYASLGFVGDTVKVKDGFARNFLFPKKIALPANSSNMKLLEHRKRVLDVKKAEKKKTAEHYKDKIEGVEVRLTHAVSEGGKLFGSVTVAEIHDELIKNNDINIDRKLLKLDAPIKATGEYFLEIKLHQEVTARLKVIVAAKEEKKAKATPAKKKEAKTDQPESDDTRVSAKETEVAKEEEIKE